MAVRKLRVHIENMRSKPEVYHLTPERWSAACARHRALAQQVKASFGWDGEILENALPEADIVIGLRGRIEQLAERAPQLKWIHATLAGVDRFFPLDWLPRGVAFTNNRGAHGAKAGEFVRMALGMLNSRMPGIIANQHAHRWQQLFSPRIAGKTALVVGLGDLGQAAAHAAKQLGLKVIGVSRSAKKIRHTDAVHTPARLDALLPKADFVILAIPFTAQTQGLLSRARLDLMKPTAGLINIARAQVADYRALCGKLARGELAGAVLDVVDPEPLPAESPLWDTPNLVITPHVSCDDSDHYVDISLDLWFANLARFLQGKPLKNRVNSRHGY